MFMNQAEVEWAYQNQHACPNVRKGVRLLYQLMQSVNEQSDGWAYWSVPHRACDKLVELLKTAGNLMYDTRGTISEADLRKAIAPIRRMATVQREKQKQYGGSFEFDVDAALKE